MKKLFYLLLAAAAMTACEDFLGKETQNPENGKGILNWHFCENLPSMTKAAEELPDTNDFILTVSDSKGTVLYSGSYGASPDKLQVGEGSYSISVRSQAFKAPAFASPLYGDDQVVVVKDGESVSAALKCTLLNCGIRLRTDPSFLTVYPGGALFVKSSDGRLPYSYSEKRIAYFNPGQISVTMTDNGSLESTLLTRNIAAREILTVSISAAKASGNSQASPSALKIQVDTSKYWMAESYTIGEESNPGKDLSSALSVSEAMSRAPATDVWVYGYIVGGDLTSAGTTVKTSEITKNTHLAIASRSSVTAKASCIAVELPKGAIRDALNLVDHPSNIGRKVFVRGDLVTSYFGTIGLKSTDDYSL